TVSAEPPANRPERAKKEERGGRGRLSASSWTGSSHVVVATIARGSRRDPYADGAGGTAGQGGRPPDRSCPSSPDTPGPAPRSSRSPRTARGDRGRATPCGLRMQGTS